MKSIKTKTQIATIFLILTLVLAACERPFRTDTGSTDPETTDGETDSSGETDNGGETDTETDGGESDGSATDGSTDEGDTDAGRPDAGEEAGGDDEGAAGDGAGTEEEATSEEGAEQEDEGEATGEDEGETAEGETGAEEGDATEGETAEGGEEGEGEAGAEEGEAAEGETSEGEATEGEGTEEEGEESASTDPAVHVVAAGENLYRIGLQYNVSWVAIAEANSLPNANAIYVGQELTIPSSENEAGGEEGNDEAEASGEVTHVVQAGETLHTIGLQYGVNWTQIAEANGLVNPNRILVGQVLKIPSDTPGPAPQFVHTVRAGETLFILSLRYGVLWTDIATANEIEAPYVIFPGQQLVIPGG